MGDVQVPSLAALALLAVFAQIGIWVDGVALGWAFGIWLVLGAVVATVLVRPIGLWVVAPSPPVVFLVLMVGSTAWRQQSFWGSKKEFAAAVVPWLVHGFPWLAAAVAGALLAAAGKAIWGKRNAGLR